MPLSSLPFEILTEILRPSIPYDWSRSLASRTSVLQLRTVCRNFDHVVSQLAFRMVGHLAMLSHDHAPEKSETIKWLLLTKAKMESTTGLTVFEYFYECALLMASQGYWVPSSIRSDWEWLDVVCQAIIAARGPRFALRSLVYELGNYAWTQLLEQKYRIERTGSTLFRGGRVAIPATHLVVALPLASLTGEKEAVEALLRCGGKPNICHNFFGNPVYNATYNNHVDILALLVKNGGDLATSGDSGTLMEVACQRGHIDTIQYLLNYNKMQDMDCVRKGLFRACKMGQEEVVRLLLRWGDEVNETNRRAMEASSQLGFSMIKRLPIFEPNRAVNGDGTPLSVAVASGHRGIVRMLTARDDVYQRFSNHRFCPLWLATIHDYGDLVQLLLERYHVNPNNIIKKDKTLLCAAAGLGCTSVARVLLQRSDVDPNHRVQEKHTTPLSLAVRRGHIDVVKLLLERPDLDPNFPVRGWRPLQRAVKKGNEPMVRLLLSRPDIDPNICYVPSAMLGSAVRMGRLDVVRLLLKRPDIDPNLRNTDGRGDEPLEIPITHVWLSIVSQLLQNKDVIFN